MPHHDILEQPDSLRNPLLGSIAFHAGVFALGVVYATLMIGKHESLGSRNAGGGAIEIGVINPINLPSRTGHPNPVANDTESQVPMPPPQKVQRRSVQPEPKGVPLNRMKVRPEPREVPQRKWVDSWSHKANQVTSTEGRAVVSQLYQLRGGGSIGIGPGVFGERFGAYAQLIAQRVAQQWQTAGLDPHSQAQPAVVTFDIQRDGSIRNVMLMQRSGNFTVDTTAQRAVLQAAPFPPLPAGFGRDVANVELKFNLQ